MKKNIKYFFSFILGVVAIVYILELLVTIFLPSKINVHINLNQLRYNEAQKMNAYYDTRNIKQAFLEEKEKLPDLAPKYLFLFYLEKTFLLEGIQKQSIKKFIETKIENKSLIPLRGPINKKTLTCNEDGKRKIANNDKNGFKNPNKIYEKKIKVFLIGDSFAEGMCQDENNDVAGILRNDFKVNAANFGVAGAGPLTSLAVLKEYAKTYKPNVVVYFYYDRNDMQDLEKEKKSFLINYLGNYDQNLINRSLETQKFLNEYEDLVHEIIKSVNLENKEYYKAQNELEKKTKIQVFKDFVELQGIKNIVFSKSSFKNSHKIDENLFSDILIEMKSEIESWDGRLIFVYLPDWGRFYQKYSFANFFHKKKIESIVKSQSIDYLDMVKEFKKENNPIRFFPFGIYGHYTRDGYNLIAKNLIKIF